MSRPRRIKKEDIGNPSNFVHVKHVGFGNGLACRNQPDTSNKNAEVSLSLHSSSVEDDTTTDDSSYKVERRNKGLRSSQIPRHHRSTTTCIFPSEKPYALSRRENQSAESHDESLESPGISSHKSSLSKPTFGSLLNLSFLPLGLGKSSSSKSPSISKTKRMSLLNLTASNLFANPNKASYEENPETVHMTGYIRRRDEDKDGSNANKVPSPLKHTNSISESVNGKSPPPKPPRSNSNASSARIPLAKLGRSKSSMAEFTKRPKLRLKIAPPPVAPPPVPLKLLHKTKIETEDLPSPPPSPIPTPPPSPPVQATATPPPPLDEVAMRIPKSVPVPRPRIIPLPSTSSLDSADPSSPQYLTPAGGCSPLPINEFSFPVLSPTIPPSSTPLFSQNRNAPGTPPVWPLQPNWPSVISIQSTVAPIPEVPSPSRDEMEILDGEYDPVKSIVDSFLSPDPEPSENSNVDDVMNGDQTETEETNNDLELPTTLAVTSENAEMITSILRDTVQYTDWPRIAQKLFENTQNDSGESNPDELKPSEKDVYTNLLLNTLVLWSQKAGDNALVEKLFSILAEENHHQATESLRTTLQQFRMEKKIE